MFYCDKIVYYEEKLPKQTYKKKNEEKETHHISHTDYRSDGRLQAFFLSAGYNIF